MRIFKKKQPSIFQRITAMASNQQSRTRQTVIYVSMLSIAGALVLAYIVGSIYWFNRDVIELTRIQGAKSDLEKELKRRDDLFSNLLTITEEYARHEKNLFHYVAETREKINSIVNQEGDVSAEKNELLTQLIARAEQYPELKATAMFVDLMDAIEITQNRIAAARDNYVTKCEDYNICNQTYWCNFFTYFINIVIPFPVFVDLFEAERIVEPQLHPEDLVAGDNIGGQRLAENK